MVETLNKQKMNFIASLQKQKKKLKKYVRDVKLKKDNYNNYCIRTIMIMFSPKTSYNYSPSLWIMFTKVCPLLPAIYPKLEKVMKQIQMWGSKTLMNEALEREDTTLRNNQDGICFYFNNLKNVELLIITSQTRVLREVSKVRVRSDINISSVHNVIYRISLYTMFLVTFLAASRCERWL